MGCAKGHIGKERPIGSYTFAVTDHADQLVDHVFTDVVAVFGLAWRIDWVVVRNKTGVELVGLTFQKPIEAVEPAAEWPLVERPRSRALLHRGQVPFANAERCVSLCAENFGHSRCVVRDMTELVGEPGAEVRNRTHADRMLRAAGQQRRSSRRAQRGHMEIGELGSTGCQRINVWCVDVGAVAAELGEAGVVE